MKLPLRVLVVEDSEFDAKMLVRLLDRGGYATTSERVQTADAMAVALSTKEWDLVLSDYNLPGFNATLALQLLQATKLDIPFIIVSGQLDADAAVAAMRAGATDYVRKANLPSLRPRLERADATFIVRAGRSLAVELGLAIAVLLVAAVLTDSKPPTPPGAIANAAAAVSR